MGDGVEKALRHHRCEAPVEVGEQPFCGGVTGIDPYGDPSILSEKPWETFEGGLRVGCVVENADAEYEIECLVPKRKLEYVRLGDIDVLPAPYVALSSLNRPAQIDPNDGASPSRHHIREPAHSATDVKDEPAVNVFWIEAGFGSKRPLRFIAARAVELGYCMDIPLEAEVLDVELAADETWDAADDRKAVSVLTLKLALFRRLFS